MGKFKENLLAWTRGEAEPIFAESVEFKNLIESIIKDYRTLADHYGEEVSELLTAIKVKYRFQGVAYHGITSMVDYKYLIPNYRGFTSFTDDIEVAYNFASNGDTFFTTTVVLEKVITGINFGKFLSDMKDYLVTGTEWFDEYLKEREILSLADFTTCRVINVSGKSLDEVKNLVDLTVDEDIKKYVNNFVDACSDSYGFYKLEKEGRLDKFKVELFKPCYRGLCSSNEVFKRGYLKDGKGSFSSKKYIAYDFALQLEDTDVHNVILKVKQEDINYAIDIKKLVVVSNCSDMVIETAFREDEYYINYNNYELEDLNKSNVMDKPNTSYTPMQLF